MAYLEGLDRLLADTPIDKGEVMRYMAAREADDDLGLIIDECAKEVKNVLSAKLCYEEYNVLINGDEVDLGFCKIRSRDLSKNLSGFDKTVVFVATAGLGIDRLILKYKTVSPTKALCISAIGSERAEAVCDIFCKILAEKYSKVNSRYSAGYGDLDLSMQREIFRALDCTKNIGVALSESLLMTPTKSVTAIVGVKKESGK